MERWFKIILAFSVAVGCLLLSYPILAGTLIFLHTLATCFVPCITSLDVAQLIFQSALILVLWCVSFTFSRKFWREVLR